MLLLVYMYRCRPGRQGNKQIKIAMGILQLGIIQQAYITAVCSTAGQDAAGYITAGYIKAGQQGVVWPGILYNRV